MAIFTNQAVLTYNNVQTLSNVTTGQIIESLTVEKTSSKTVYSAGEAITYVVTLQNTGTTAYSGLTVVDDLGAFTGPSGQLVPLTYVAGSFLYLLDGVRQPTPSISSTSPLTAGGITVPAGGSTVLIYEAQVNDTAPLDVGGAIVNTVTVDGGGLAQSVEDSYTVNAENAPYLTIEKTLDPLTVSGSGTITYTFTINNYGNTAAEADANVTVTDTLAPPLTDLTVTYNGTPWTEGVEYTYSATAGTFATTAGEITVPAATFTTGEDGVVTTTPGTSTLVIEGTVG